MISTIKLSLDNPLRRLSMRVMVDTVLLLHSSGWVDPGGYSVQGHQFQESGASTTTTLSSLSLAKCTPRRRSRWVVILCTRRYYPPLMTYGLRRTSLLRAREEEQPWEVFDLSRPPVAHVATDLPHSPRPGLTLNSMLPPRYNTPTL